ncbi:hypothetical protein BKA69DRAFT_302733 [Paraphysoderma sedebokerense]|nr:hypothetical protein BKA69DRAFT_302733 [Paraphysoderma sedebokerense]
MAIFSSALLIKSSSNNYNPLMLILLVASLVAFVYGQSRWQDVTTFHPYCVRLFRSCVESSSIGGVGSGDYNVAVGICGNKMAICTFSGNLNWPWSSSSARPASASVDATPRLTMYRNILSESSATVTSTPWQNLTIFLPDCRAEFRRCVDNSFLAACGHGMSICTERQGRWPYGNDSSAFWQQPYTNDRLTLYWNVYSGNPASRNWQSLTIFLPLCRNLMTQCVAVSGGASSNAAVGICGNRMAICTFENILWPQSYDASSAYTDSYDARWQRYANVINSIFRWQDITRFSVNCTDRFFACVYASTNATDDAVIGVCGNQMSLCTFNDSIWPNASQVPTTPDSYSTRLDIYRAMFEHMLPGAPSYFKFPLLNFELYSFSTHTFTNAGAIGRVGPMLSACRTAYASQSWAQESNVFTLAVQGIQEWTVPRAGNYRIAVKGAAGAGTGAYYGGKGAFMEGTFLLRRGDVLCIVVGQMGVFGPWSESGGGGGGGSFVYVKSSNTLLIAAGGGGGGGCCVGYGGFGSNTTIPVNGGGSGNGGYSEIGYGGNGGALSIGHDVRMDWNDAAGGGGGWLGDGGFGAMVGGGDYVGHGGKGRLGNFVGGRHASSLLTLEGQGGFGGGGGLGGYDRGFSGGGGGGYTGGGGGNTWNGTLVNSNWPPGSTVGGGQGGGSFNAGADQVNTPNNCSTHGSVTITAL